MPCIAQTFRWKSLQIIRLFVFKSIHIFILISIKDHCIIRPFEPLENRIIVPWNLSPRPKQTQYYIEWNEPGARYAVSWFRSSIYLMSFVDKLKRSLPHRINCHFQQLLSNIMTKVFRQTIIGPHISAANGRVWKCFNSNWNVHTYTSIVGSGDCLTLVVIKFRCEWSSFCF